LAPVCCPGVGPSDKTAFIFQTLQVALYNKAFLKDAERYAVIKSVVKNSCS